MDSQIEIFKNYIRQLEEYHFRMNEIQVEGASGGCYYVCRVCRFATHSDEGLGCRCDDGPLKDVCIYCVCFADGIENLAGGRIRCTFCRKVQKVPLDLPPLPEKPVFPF